VVIGGNNLRLVKVITAAGKLMKRIANVRQLGKTAHQLQFKTL